MNRILALAVATCLCVAPGFASEVDGIVELEQKLITQEKRLLESELKQDRAIVENWKFRGILGWLQGLFSSTEKKALQALLMETEQSIKKEFAGMKASETSLQQEVFNVGYAFEQKGDFAKAIEFYKKVVHKDDKVLLRIGSCYQKLKQYSEAITWYLKMQKTDANFLLVVECYWEAALPKDAITWLFRILDPYNKNAAELKALELMDRYEYSNRDSDFPGFSTRLSDVYLAKTLSYFSESTEIAASDYKRAVNLRSAGQDLQTVSMQIVQWYFNKVEEARNTLEEKRSEAFEHFEYLLRQAEQKISREKDRLRDAEMQAMRDYEYALNRSRQELSEARLNLDDVQKNQASTPEQIDYAQKRLRNAEYRLQDLMNNRIRFIEEEISPYKEKLERAQREYNQLIQNRAQIIEDYIAPYKRALKASEDNEKVIRRLHQMIF
ncbi:MAG: tetratricopeptide repeat protein [Candidatus Cloacimonetes bacterium]|nr:tetratricopeptide repeat protein [Candidatus Cloacimonadota bacterium]